nr:4'-phosphopantetheinyl transferase superfamily protein [Clostridia bacterium]
KNPSLLRTACSPYGKPYAVSNEDFHFSISHSGNYTAIACAGDEIGADIEQIDRRLDRRLIADTVFTSEERAYIFSPSDEALRRVRFARLWTAKESCLKYLGTGLSRSPLTVEFDMAANRIVGSDAVLTGMQTADGYFLTVCGMYDDCRVEVAAISELNRFLNRNNTEYMN